MNNVLILTREQLKKETSTLSFEEIGNLSHFNLATVAFFMADKVFARITK